MDTQYTQNKPSLCPDRPAKIGHTISAVGHIQFAIGHTELPRWIQKWAMKGRGSHARIPIYDTDHRHNYRCWICDSMFF